MSIIISQVSEIVDIRDSPLLKQIVLCSACFSEKNYLDKRYRGTNRKLQLTSRNQFKDAFDIMPNINYIVMMEILLNIKNILKRQLLPEVDPDNLFYHKSQLVID